MDTQSVNVEESGLRESRVIHINRVARLLKEADASLSLHVLLLAMEQGTLGLVTEKQKKFPWRFKKELKKPSGI